MKIFYKISLPLIVVLLIGSALLFFRENNKKGDDFLIGGNGKQCPESGFLSDQQITRCYISKEYDLVVEKKDSTASQNSKEKQFSVSVNAKKKGKSYKLFDVEDSVLTAYFNIQMLKNRYLELQWGYGDMGWLYVQEKVFDLRNNGNEKIDIVEKQDGLTIKKDGVESKMNIDLDNSNFFMGDGEGGGQKGYILAKGINLNGKPLGLLTKPLTVYYGEGTDNYCEMGCPYFDFPMLKFNSTYSKDFSKIIFSLKGKDFNQNYIFNIKEQKIEQ